MKDALLEAEEQNSGRVPLTKFYQKGLEKGLHFVETPAYLRQLGALDESQPGEAQLIIPNFIVSPNNSLVDTGSYSVCCLNECEGVMAKLEGALGASEATPEQIISAVSDISTSTVNSPRDLPKALMVRLELVAERNGGKVPLYGRLFAQWLHFAFPHECPFPHSTGSTNPLTPGDYAKATSEKANMRMNELHEYINRRVGSSDMAQNEPVQDDHGDHLLKSWSDHEEMLFAPVDAPRSLTSTLLKSVFVLALGASVFVAAGDAAKRVGGLGSVLGKPEKAHLV
jgi:hypothetical protein